MYHRIVVGTDGSATAERAVDAAGGIARLTGGSVHVVAAYRPVRVVAVADGATATPTWFGEEERAAAEEVAAAAADRLTAQGIAVMPVARVGEAAEVLLAVADEFDADLLVVGTRGRGGARRARLGSVTDRVLQHAPCAVHVARGH
jgi:nucleotide-binding universal stress UspA family protein